MPPRSPAIAVLLLHAAACSTELSSVRASRDSGPEEGGLGGGGGASSDAASEALVRARPYRLATPRGHDPRKPAPLLLLLHGYGVDGYFQAVYFGLLGPPEDAGAEPVRIDGGDFLLAFPDGTMDSTGRRFWNATDACCDRDGSGVDDVAYLTAVVDDIEARYAVDGRRVYVLGHSNGAFMAHRFACERALRVTAIAALNGAGWSDPARCRPAAKVSVLAVHGDADDLVRYEGGTTARGTPYPSAEETVRAWADRNGCTGALMEGPPKDLDTRLEGAETRTLATAGCPAGGSADLWILQGGVHIPSLGASWTTEVWAHLAQSAAR